MTNTTPVDPTTHPPIRCAVIGVGRMGNHHARVYSTLPGATLVGVYDANPARAGEIAEKYGCHSYSGSLTDLLDAADPPQAVSICVPTVAHLEVARPFIEAGTACLIEKPLASSVDEAAQLAELAATHNATLQVGHIERFNPAVRALSRHGDLVPRFIEVHRVSPMTFRSVDVGVVFDMMIHDLDVILMLAGAEPAAIQSAAVSVLGASEDVCNARLEFPNGCVANVTASRLALKTERKLRLIADDAYVSIDYAKKNGVMIRRTANAEQLDAVRAELAAGADMSDLDYMSLINVDTLDIDDEDQLQMELTDFLESYRTGRRPTVDVQAGFAAVRTAQRIVDTARQHADRIHPDRSGTT
ncbi:MAG: Gfo/Idh/MocA family oxidoreductase [Planctomycetes bacterium]|nr:Gfo/Idh/MocA family oxidoreductase [Planctomycetota bacterium]